MTILEVATNKMKDATVAPLEHEDLKKIKRSRYFFDWKIEAQANTTYKLTLTGEDDIKGLMSIVDHPAEERIEIGLLAVSKEKVVLSKERGKKQKGNEDGKGKRFERAWKEEREAERK